MPDILYVGSGRSALQCQRLDKTNLITCAANNAWRLFDKVDYWIHPGDFPRENFAPPDRFAKEISYKDYQVTARRFCEELRIDTKYPEHYLGYTTFFNGLYWIIYSLRPQNIYLLGFDHDYNPAKVDKWLVEKPNPQNGFLKDPQERLEDWGERYFAGHEKDFFYGHGTPDPLRLGEKYLIDKFQQAKILSKQFGVKIWNASSAPSKINCFDRISLAQEI